MDPALQGLRSIGDYELLEEIGRGGMGVVWRARQVSLNRIVAVKLLLAGTFASEDACARFRREARSVATLRHPNIVAVHEIGEFEGRPYFSMDFIQGQNLSARLGRSPPSPRQIAHWLLTLAEAVSHAHSRGIVHRDLKPANILIDQDDAPHLTDFGLAKALDDKSDLTLTGQALGSASYMAPEQASGRNADVTEAADIYALGAVLYHLLTGRPPFQAESVAGTLKQVVEGDPVPPRRLSPSVPRDLETICLKCLEKSPGRRYASAQALADDLRCWLDRKPIQARPATATDKAGKWIRRNPVVAGLAALLVLALAGGLAATSRQLFRAEKFLSESRSANVRLAENLAYREQRDAEALFERLNYSEGLMALARMVHDNPSNRLASARLFSALAATSWPWPVLPALVHEAGVEYGAFTPNRRSILTASRDGWVHVWNATSAVRQVSVRHETMRGRFALSPEGACLATLGTNGSAQLWRIPGGEFLFEVTHAGTNLAAKPGPVPPPIIAAVAFSQDGTLLATGGTDGWVSFWRVLDGQLEHRLEHREPIRLLNFQPGGSKFLSVGNTQSLLWELPFGVRNWQTNAAAPPVTIPTPAPPAWAEFTTKGDRLLLVASNTVQLWDTQAGTCLRVLKERPIVNCGTFSSDGRLIALADGDGRLPLFRSAANERAYVAFHHDRAVNTVRFCPGESELLSASDDGTACVRSAETRRALTESMRHRQPVRDAIFDPSRNQVLTFSADQTAKLWYIRRPLQVELRLRYEVATTQRVLSSDGQLIAAAGEDNAVRVLDLDLRKHGGRVRHQTPLTSLAFDSATERLASANEAGTVMITEARTGKAVCEPFQCGHPARSLKWCSQQPILAAVTQSNVWICDLRNVQSMTQTVLRIAGVQVLDFSPDGRQVAVAGGEPSAQIFETRNGQPAGQPLDHPGPLLDLEFSSNGELIATAGRSNAARVWDAKTAKPITPWIRGGGDVVCVSWCDQSWNGLCDQSWNPDGAPTVLLEAHGHGQTNCPCFSGG